MFWVPSLKCLHPQLDTRTDMRAIAQQLKPEIAGRRPVLASPVDRRFSTDRFPEALKGLMEERHLSYRQLAYKTQLSAGYLNHLTKGSRPVPADPVIENLATALHVEADFFLEFRLRQVARVLGEAPPLADKLYGILACDVPVTDDIVGLLSDAQDGDGGKTPDPSAELGIVVL
jgi:transcriptional regulator with XRE-family HTH domain